MFWLSKVIAPLALVAGMAVSTSVVFADADGNQPPFGKGGFQPFGKGQPGRDTKKTEDKKDDRKDDKKADPGDRKGPKSDATVDAWVKVLLEKITDPHDTVRDSARAAVVAVGPPAIPALEKLVDGNDSAKAVAARKLITAIQHGHNPQGPGPQGPGQPGPNRPGFGPHGPPLGPPQEANPMNPGRPPMGPMNPMNPGRPPMGPFGPGFPGGDRPGFPGGPNTMMDRLLGDLQLSDKQQKQVKEIQEGHGKKLREFSEQLRDGKIERKDWPETMEKLQKELLADVKKVLNEDQFKKLQERLPNGRFPLFPGPFGPNGPGERPKQPDRPERE